MDFDEKKILKIPPKKSSNAVDQDRKKRIVLYEQKSKSNRH